MVQDTVQSGTKYLDKLNGTFSYVSQQGSKVLQVATNTETGKVVTTVLRNTFNAAAKLPDGTQRFIKQ